MARGHPLVPARTGLPGPDRSTLGQTSTRPWRARTCRGASRVSSSAASTRPCAYGPAAGEAKGESVAVHSSPARTGLPPLVSGVRERKATRPLRARACLFETTEELDPSQPVIRLSMCPAKPCDQGVKGRPVTLLPRRVLLRTHPLRSLPPESFRQWLEATSCPPDGQALICLFTRCTIKRS